jgi:ribosomal protein L11 methyltransferase
MHSVETKARANMDWIEISIQADGEAAEAVSELFNRLNSRPDGQGGAVTEIGGFDPVGEEHHPVITVKTYLPADDPQAADLQREIEEGLWHLGRIHPLGEPRVRRLAETDWANAWKASYRPLRIGRRLLVIPAWEREQVRPAPDDLPIYLDPGLAFGTGLHPSTQLCMIALEETMRPGLRVLDAGCGSGILSIAAARLGASRVDAFDIDPIAARATEENVALNDLSAPVHVFVSAGPDESAFWRPADRPRPTWDVIVINILPHVIVALLDAGIHTYLASAGRLILAGIIAEREGDVRAALAEHGLSVMKRLVDGDWVALVGVGD